MRKHSSASTVCICLMLLVVWEEKGVSKVLRCDKQPAQVIFFLVCYGKNSSSSNIAKMNIQFSLWFLTEKKGSKQTNKQKPVTRSASSNLHPCHPCCKWTLYQIWEGFKFIDAQVPYVLCRGIFFDNLMNICKCMSTSLIGTYLQTIETSNFPCWKTQKAAFQSQVFLQQHRQ